MNQCINIYISIVIKFYISYSWLSVICFVVDRQSLTAHAVRWSGVSSIWVHQPASATHETIIKKFIIIGYSMSPFSLLHRIADNCSCNVSRERYRACSWGMLTWSLNIACFVSIIVFYLYPPGLLLLLTSHSSFLDWLIFVSIIYP